jgi:uncharacterized protein
MKALHFLTLFFICCFSVTTDAGDSDFPNPPNPPRLVNDFSAVLSESEMQFLEDSLNAIEKRTSNQITIVIIKSTGLYEIADYATQLGNKWGVGVKGRENGVLLLVAIEDRKITIATGRVLEGALTDAMCGRIIRNEIKPAFKQGQYLDGLLQAVSALDLATRGEYEAIDRKHDDKSKGISIGLILFVFLIIFILSKGNNNRGGGITPFLGGMLMGGGFGGGSNNDSDSGGFGGFGGGSFGGGGASGSW